MWHTSRGDRTLRNEEAVLVRTSIESLIDTLLVHVDEEIQNEEIGADSRIDCELGIVAYDSLTISQRIALLHDVAMYLLTDTDKVLALSAELEAAVAAIFVEIRDQVVIEINFPSIDDLQAGPTWRTLVRDAYVSAFTGPAEGEYPSDDSDEFLPSAQIPSPQSCDIDQWEFLIELLSDAILWDRDFEMADSFLDGDPDVSQHRQRLLGINNEYFTSIAHDPMPDEVYRLVSRTREIVRAKPR